MPSPSALRQGLCNTEPSCDLGLALSLSPSSQACISQIYILSTSPTIMGHWLPILVRTAMQDKSPSMVCFQTLLLFSFEYLNWRHPAPKLEMIMDDICRSWHLLLSASVLSVPPGLHFSFGERERDGVVALRQCWPPGGLVSYETPSCSIQVFYINGFSPFCLPQSWSIYSLHRC